MNATKRDLFAELSEGMTALAPIRLGKHSGTVRGSGNIYRDFDVPDADVRQLKSILAAEIIKTLDKKGLTAGKGAQAHRHRCRRFLARPQRGFPAHQGRAPRSDDQRAWLTRESGGDAATCGCETRDRLNHEERVRKRVQNAPPQ